MSLKGFKSVAGLAADAAKAQISDAIQAGLRQVLFGLLIVLFLLLAVSFAFAALTVWLAQALGTIPALGIMAAAFLILALILYVVAQSARPKKRRRQSGQAHQAEAAAAFIKEELDAENPPPGAALGALTLVALVGFTLARRMFKR